MFLGFCSFYRLRPNHSLVTLYFIPASGIPRNFSEGGLGQEIFFGGVQQSQLRTEGRENGYLGAVAP
jgi:hypothetical protein